MIVHQKEKEGISREEALKIIRSEYEIEEESCEPKQKEQIQSLTAALKDCCLEMINGESFLVENNTKGGVYQLNFIDDGNTTLSLFEDEQYYYSIFYETS